MKTKLKRRLPHDYLNKYMNVEISKADYIFIKGCLNHQQNYLQLNNLQWDVIQKIEKKYLNRE